jgi:oxygen-independent coproporphyrinogen-3 oxidase
VTSSVEITVEGVAQLFTEAKLEAMREAGVNRISMGVQQLDFDLLRLSGRKQNVAHVARMLALCHDIGLRTSVDLIYGWPQQSIVHMLRDLEAVIEWRVAHITHYELNVAGQSEFARKQAELPSAADNREMYRAAKELLENRGYRQVTPYDWERIDAGPAAIYVYEALARRPIELDADGGITGCDTWGWGFAALSVYLGSPRAPGWTFMNCPHVDDYYRRLDEGVFPAERGYHYDEADLRLYVLFNMLQGLAVNRVLYRNLFGVDPVEEHEPIWSAVADRGWAHIKPERIVVDGDGGFYVPLIQRLLAEDRLAAMRRARFESAAA